MTVLSQLNSWIAISHLWNFLRFQGWLVEVKTVTQCD